jgi:hypothetical protein
MMIDLTFEQEMFWEKAKGLYEMGVSYVQLQWWRSCMFSRISRGSRYEGQLLENGR